MKKVLFFIAIVILASCNSNEEASNIKEQFQEEFLNKSSNEDYNDDQLGYFKSLDVNSITERNDERTSITTVWVTYGEYKEIRSNPDYLFFARKTKDSNEENPVIVSEKYIGAGSGHDPFDMDDDINDDPNSRCKQSNVRRLEDNKFYNSTKGCAWSYNSWKQHLQNEANATCLSYKSPYPICCKGVYYGYVIAVPQITPCTPKGIHEPGREIGETTGKWIAYTPEATHN